MKNNNEMLKLVQSAIDGNEDALNALFSECYDDIYYFAFSTLKDQNTACDITQETCITILKEIGNLREAAAFVSWSRRIAYRHCLRYINKNKEVLASETEDGDTVFDILEEENTEFIPDEALEKDELSREIMNIVNSLGDEQRAAVMLYYFDELSVDKIAEIQGVPAGTVKSRLNYARKNIKQSVEEYEKKTGTKLHCTGVLPILIWLFRNQRLKNPMPYAAKQAVKATVEISVSSAAKAAAGAVAGGAAKGIGAKIAAAVIAVAITAGVGVGVYNLVSDVDSDTDETRRKKDKESTYELADKDDISPETDDADKDEQGEDDAVSREKYESATLVPYDDQYVNKENFKEFIDNNASTYMTKDGSIYSLGSAEEAVFSAEELKYGISAHGGDGLIAYKDKDGYLNVPLNTGGYNVVLGVRGEFLYAFSDILSGKICVISIEGNQLYYSNFDRTGAVADYHNEPMAIYNSVHKKYYNTIDYIEVVNGNSGLLYVESEGERFYDTLTSVSFFDDIPQIWLRVVTSSADKILDYGFYYISTSPLYTKAGVDNAIYYADGMYTENELPIYLPECYSVSDIKEVRLGSSTVIWFNDNTVWTCDLVHTIVGPDLVKNEELSELAANGHLIELYVSNYRSDGCAVLVHLDDNVLYEVLENK